METKREDLACYLAAAFLAYTSGIKSIDYFKRTYIKGDVGEFWHYYAKNMSENYSKQLQVER